MLVNVDQLFSIKFENSINLRDDIKSYIAVRPEKGDLLKDKNNAGFSFIRSYRKGKITSKS